MPRSRNIEDFEGELVNTLNAVQTEVGEKYNQFEQRIKKWYEVVNYAMAQAEKGIEVAIPKFKDFHPTDDNNVLKDTTNVKNGTTEAKTIQPETVGRSKRSAALKASESINSQVNLSLAKKLRKPSELKLKQERLSECLEENESAKEMENIEPPTMDLNAVVKVERMEMPPPTRAAPKAKRGRPPSTKVKQEKIDEELKRSSRLQSKNLPDVILEEIPIDTIVLSDSDTEEVNVSNSQQKKRNRSINEGEDRERKRSRSSSSSKEEDSHYDDAVSTAPEKIKTANPDATFVTSSSNAPALNTTVVLEKATVLKEATNITDDLMTDDESYDYGKPSASSQIPKPTTTTKTGKVKPIKQVFSAFEQSPVKKKVAAFEKLKDEAALTTTTRVTRTKTKAMAKENEEKDETDDGNQVEQKLVKEKVKMFTPAAPSKILPLASSTSIKKGAKNISTSSVSNKTSVTKGPQSEYKELKRQEEAIRKREALLQAKTEEKKRIREEKHEKAMTNRELMEKEKKKLLEAHRLKEERLLAEQEERRLRKAEEKKKMMEEEKRRLEAEKALLKAKAKHTSSKPIYMVTRAPKLSTDYDFDSDDEDQPEHPHVPDWAQSKALERQQKLQLMLGEQIKNTFFSIQAQTTDLQEIFEVIEPAKLKRSSSACWGRPPRFTMIPNQLLESFREESDED